MSAKFVVVTHHCVRKVRGEGYSWGLLLVKNEKIYISQPAQRSNVDKLQKVDGSFLDSFRISDFRPVVDTDLQLFDRLKRWSVDVIIPEELFDDNGDLPYPGDICNYLRAHINGDFLDPHVYEIPKELGEMIYNPHEFDEREIVV